MPGEVADPVRELMARHRSVCEQAVDALEIAAALEDSGIGPGEAARYRHADVFSLAEELYARVPRHPPRPMAAAGGARWRERVGAALRSAVRHGAPAGVLAVGCAVSPAARGPLAVLCGGWLAWAASRPAGLTGGAGDRARGVTRVPGTDHRVQDHHVRGDGRTRHPGPGLPPRAGVPAARLLAGVAVGGLLVGAVLGGGVPGVAAAVGAGAAEWAVGWVRQVGRGHLAAARTLADFRALMRPVLPVAVGLHALAVTALGFGGLLLLAAADPAPQGAGLFEAALLRASGPQWAGQLVLGLVLLPAVVLLRCGRPGPAVAGLVAAGAGRALLTVAQHGAPAAQVLACAPVAAVLLPYAWLVLGRPGAHRDP
ncbi:hypothetical protein ACIRBX_20910 [Kitasatospora sp. NPDC096147]|uniref:hypothetical protein n=1 Tax=Kitasatospora sp. NPDC096147 TaxID=3364093 RepID=UPI00381CF3A5